MKSADSLISQPKREKFASFLWYILLLNQLQALSAQNLTNLDLKIQLFVRIFASLLGSTWSIDYNFKYIALRMLGLDDFIKGQEPSFGSQNYQKQKNFNAERDLVNHCLTTFYDQDSNDSIIQAKCSVQQVMCYLEHTHDLCDTPLAEIVQSVIGNAMFKGVDLDLLKRKVIKKKNELKRTRAKNRKMIIREHIIANVSVPQDCEEEEFKKQRNRISAQISRDKKKEKMKALEELNRQLEEECKQQKAQNERLRKQAQQRGINQPPKNKFTFMLVFLGLFFLLGMIKEMFQGSESNQTIAKIQEMATTAILPDKELSYYSRPEYQPKVLEEIEQTLTDTFENKGIAKGIKERIRQSMNWWQPEYKGPLSEPLIKVEHEV